MPKETKPEKVQMVLYVTPELKQALKRYADADDRSVNRFVIRILEDYIGSHPEGRAK